MFRGLVALGILAATFGLAHHSSASEEALSPEEFSPSEEEALQKAKTPRKQLRVYLDIVFNRLKQFRILVRKCDQEQARRYLTGYALALNRADDLAAGEDPDQKKAQKLLRALLKSTQKINASLIQTIEKVPQDCRPVVQEALQVSQQVNGAVHVQLLRAGTP
ncbi:MAG: hypothetical protein F4Z21_03950 [Acidobacteria bacterium]|nr:hypothetical protein [Acidobacteriota bacterium]